MKKKFTASVLQEDQWFVAQCLEVDVASQGDMANYKVPRYAEVIDELPMNASGKVTKFVLRERAVPLLEGRAPEEGKA